MKNTDYERAEAVLAMPDPFVDERFMVYGPKRREPLHDLFDPWVQAARQMAAAIRGHDEEGGQAGTHAYDLVAATEVEHVKDTEMLIHMTAATVLHRLIAEEGGGRSNITFSPFDMDEMHKLYHIDVSHDGMATTVKLVPRKEHAATLVAHNDRPDNTPVLSHRPAPPVEPHWFARIDGERRIAADQRSAEEAVRESLARDPGVVATVENRRCTHYSCPAPAHIDQCLATFCPGKPSK